MSEGTNRAEPGQMPRGVDSSGFGQEGEAALTFEQFVDLVGTASTRGDDVGWAIVSAGQFQVYIGQFSRVS